MLLKTKIDVLIIATVLLTVGWFFLHHHDKKVDAVNSAAVLAPIDKEKIIVDAHKHTLTTVTDQGVKSVFLPDRPSTITISKTGQVTVVSKQWGTEFNPFFGPSYGDVSRLNLGFSWFYFKKFDVNSQLAFKFDHKEAVFIKPLTSISYNVYSNTYFFIAMQPFALLSGKPDVHGGVFWRI